VDVQKTVVESPEPERVEKQLQNLETAANKWLKPYPNAAWRENIEVARWWRWGWPWVSAPFFWQPFKIPTGSMQPTLYGVTSTPDFSRGLRSRHRSGLTNLTIPTGWQRVREWFKARFLFRYQR